MSYEVTGTLNGKKFYYQTPDYEWAMKLFIGNSFKSLWKKNEDGTRKLLIRKGAENNDRK